MSAHGQEASSFTATGQSSTLVGRHLTVDLDFGTGTVVVQRDTFGDGTWFTVTDVDGNAASYTADQTINFDGGKTVNWRLNCTAHSADITYRIATY